MDRAAQCATSGMVGADDATRTRTRSGSGDDAILGAPASDVTGERRLPAPLQYRDPDRYEIIAEHGRGGLGRVYRARDKELGRDVALKELLSRGSTGELRFFREALITARLEHPGIVPVHEAGRWPDGTPFYAMKLVAGRPLKELIEACTTLEERLALLPHIIAVADAIAYAHDRKIIHRDLKPSNIIVGDFGETVVIDWGLAKDISDQAPAEATAIGEGPFRTAPPADDGVTVAGSVLGTPAYMSPEQARGEPVDERTDVYAIGRVLADTLGTSVGRVPRARDLHAIVKRATSSRPASRYPSARELADDLRRHQRRLPVSARHYSPLTRLALAGRRHRPLVAAMGLILLCSSLIATIAAIRVRAERDAALQAVSSEAAAVAELRLKHAEALLASDPAAAISLLAQYHGNDTHAARLLAALAKARGVSTETLRAHYDTIRGLGFDSQNNVISVSEDRTIVLNTPGRPLAVVATLPTIGSTFSIGLKRGLLAYEEPRGFLQIADSLGRSLASLPVGPLRRVALSPASPQVLFSTRANPNSVFLWTFDSLLPRFSHHSPRGRVRQLLFTADGIPVILTDDAALRFSSPHYHALPPGLVSLSPGNGLLATATATGDVAILPFSSHAAAIALKNPCRGPLLDLAASPAGPDVAVSCQDGHVYILRADSPNRGPRALTHLPEPARTLQYSSDGRFIGYLATSPGYIDTHTGFTATFAGHGFGPTALAFSPHNSEHLATGDSAGAVRVWHIRSWPVQQFLLPTDFAQTAKFLPDGTLVLDGSDGATSLVSPANTVTTLREASTTSYGIFPSPSGDMFVTGTANGHLVGRTAKGRLLFDVAAHSAFPQVAFLDNDTFVSSSHDGKVSTWRHDGTPLLQTLSLGSAVLYLRALHRTRSLVFSTDAPDLRVTDTSAVGATRFSTQLSSPATFIAASPSEDMVAAGEANGTLTIFDTKTWTILRTLRFDGPVEHLSFSPNSQLLSVVLKSQHIVLVHTTAPATIFDLGIHARRTAFSPQGDTVAYGTQSGEVCVYSLSKTDWLCVPGTSAVLGLAYSSDGLRLAATSVDRRVTIVHANELAFQGSPPSRTRIFP